ncbi:MAG TPA: glycosyltransferase family 2 protein [Anaeromyxobacter sp.]
MTAFRLSVCIPTYNFGAFIGETLRALVDQATDDVEIVVLDGGSTDETPAVVERFSREFPRLVYRRLDRPGGVDADIERAVALAHGEYVWLMSADDVPAPGALARMREELGSGADVYLCDRVVCDRDLRPLGEQAWLAPGAGVGPFRFSEPAELRRYLTNARSIGALFSFISAIVVRREAWDASPPGPGSIGTNYAHAARILSILRSGGRLRHVPAPLVLCRGENDSFARGGVVRRFVIDLDGYLHLAGVLGGGPEARAEFLAVMRREHPWYVYAEIRSRAASREEWKAIRGKLLAYGYAPWQVAVSGSVGAVPAAIHLARLAWFGLRRIRRALARAA